MFDDQSKIMHDSVSRSVHEQIFDCLSSDLKILDLHLLRALHENAALNDALSENNTAAFFISEEEVVHLLNLSSGPVNGTKFHNAEIHTSKAAEVENKLRDKADQAFTAFPLQQLEKIFGLDRFELGVLVMALALEIDKKYERIYAYFNNDLNKKTPSLDLALEALAGTLANKISMLGYFRETGALRTFNLIKFVNQSEDESFLSSRFKIDPGIQNFLLGDVSLHPRLLHVAAMEYPGKQSPLSGKMANILEEIRRIQSATLNSDTKGVVFWMYGKAHIEKKTIAASVSQELNIPLLVADLHDVLGEQDPGTIIKLLCREAIMHSALLYFTSGDRLSADEEKSRVLQRLFVKIIKEFSWFTFIDGQEPWSPDGSEDSPAWYPMEIPLPDFYERRKIWAGLLADLNIDGADIDAVACRYGLSESQIKKAVACLKLSAHEDSPSLVSLSKACSQQSAGQMTSRFSKKITPHYNWDDLVLADEKILHLKEICSFLKNKHLVYFKWGFDRKLALGRGLNILFTGPSGTGKTMTAEIIAADLKLDLHKVDLSCIVSKYIGETEKNLNRIFEQTAAGNAILFFDEADALFGKRSEVKDAHDRYANIETNYLLQKMEEHENVIILSTNLGKNLDEAFLRRMQFTVEFPFPDEKHRERMWRKIFPANAPLAEELDYKYFSRKLKVSGGNIKNIALAGAFLAAEEAAAIDMRHILAAARREYQKIGKPFVKSDFVPYSELLDQLGDLHG